MQVKISTIYMRAFIAIAVTITSLSCKKSTNMPCAALQYTGINPVAYLEIKDSQNRNLLDPATPGHYDSAFVKHSNGWFKLTPAGTVPVGIIFNYLSCQGANMLTLSTTDQDTLNVSLETVHQTCNFYTKLSSLTYNGTVLKADTTYALRYTVHKSN